MSGLIDKLFSLVQVNHVWLFLTERCNLACDYCFFGDRDGRTTIALDKVRALFEVLPRNNSYDVVLSGGEPLVEWRRTCEVIRFVRSLSPCSGLMVQTNGVLLDKAKTTFLRTHRVGLEFGIDGELAANAGHRRGMQDSKYSRLLKNIRGAVASGVRTSATMTVHPAETERMPENFLSLARIGFGSIEVHPAFMAPWTDRQARAFATGYRKILALDIKSPRRLVSPYYSRTVPPLLDIVVQPDGRVLPNWTYLIFPKTLRESFYLMDVSGDGEGVNIRGPAVAAYLKALGRFCTRPRTYREFSNFNACRILALQKDVRMSGAFRAYERACRKAQALDLRCLPVKQSP